MSMPGANDDYLLVEAYCDGELDAGAALALERRLATDPRLKVHQARVMALKAAIAGAGLGVPASEGACARILAGVLPGVLPGNLGRSDQPALRARAVAARVHRPPSRFDVRQMAAAIAAAAVIASGATAFLMTRTLPSSDMAAIIAGHQRALLAASPFDVASSDRHTVKPWFDGKLAISPPVPDLSAAGFKLAGGRVDIVGGKPVPTLVYTRREHLISLATVPKPGAQDGSEIHAALYGFAAETWTGQGFAYTAVSDISPAELEAFCDVWRKAVAL